MKLRDRVKELRRVRARDLQVNPSNWRRHGKAQTAALRAVLEEIGFAGALLARETSKGKLMLIDGHLRAGIAPDERVPVLVLDLNEAEANKLLLTYDPIASMAEADEQNLKALMAEWQTDNPAIRALFEQTVKDYGFLVDGDGGGESRASLQERFLVPPFSVLDARQGYWQERKRAWLALGIESEVGRGAVGVTEGSNTSSSSSSSSSSSAMDYAGGFGQRFRKAGDPPGGGGPKSVMRNHGGKIAGRPKGY